MTPASQRLGARLRAARGDRSPLVVALALGVNTSTVYRWESGAVEPSLSRLGDIAAYYGVPLADLIVEVAA